MSQINIGRVVIGGLLAGVILLRHYLFPRDMIILTSVWGLVEIIIAGVAGAWAYTEGSRLRAEG